MSSFQIRAASIRSATTKEAQAFLTKLAEKRLSAYSPKVRISSGFDSGSVKDLAVILKTPQGPLKFSLTLETDGKKPKVILNWYNLSGFNAGETNPEDYVNNGGSINEVTKSIREAAKVANRQAMVMEDIATTAEAVNDFLSEVGDYIIANGGMSKY